ncbi:MAG TPA: N-acetylmuramic acid 6-phosphate etherase [Flavobacteriales bacterium]|nr:N-acetylmuramic acid 6-phosphate etherase [Flavobacteriales bacterium]
MNKPLTEQDSNYDGLDEMSTENLLRNINREDQTVATTVETEISAIQSLVEAILARMKKGGRLFYMGAGTSGRLGVVDPSECPPTFGVDHGVVVGIIAGGDYAIRKAVEFAEDDKEQGWKDLQEYDVNDNDSVIGIAASGSTPYVVGALAYCNANNILTGCIVCNPNSAIANEANFPVEVKTGPEFVTGSTRMKAGTAQKLTLNMISTALMIKLGHVKGNKMVDMQLSNHKLVARGTSMIMDQLQIEEKEAKELLLTYGSVRKAVESKNA